MEDCSKGLLYWETTMSFLCLVTLSTVMKSSSGILMSPSLAFKRVISFDLDLRSERGCHAKVFIFLLVFPSVRM